MEPLNVHKNMYNIEDYRKDVEYHKFIIDRLKKNITKKLNKQILKRVNVELANEIKSLKSLKKEYARQLFNCCLYYHMFGNFKIAFSYCQQSVELGYAKAKNKFATYYEYPIYNMVDEKKAFNWYYQAAQQGLPKAQHNLAICYQTGFYVKINEKLALKWYLKAADNKNNKSCYNLGCMYKESNFTTSMYWFTRASEFGHITASECVQQIKKRIFHFEIYTTHIICLQKWFRNTLMVKKLKQITPDILKIYYHPNMKGGYLHKRKMMSFLDVC